MEFEQDYDILGVGIHLATNSAGIREKVRLFLGAHEVKGKALAGFQLRFAESDTLPDHRIAALQSCRPNDYVVVEQDSRVYFAVGEGVACFDPQARTCQAHVRRPAAGGQAFPNSVPLVNLVVVWTLFAAGYLPLHAAAVSHNDRLILLAGEKGAGKSTLALKLHQLGYPLICDDLVYVKRQEDQLVAGGHCQPLKVNSAEVDGWLKHCAVFEAGVRVPGKTLFPVEQFNPRGKNRLHPVEAIVFLQAAPGPDVAASVGAHCDVEVMFHLLGDAPMLNTPGYRARALDWMCGGGATRFYLAQTNLNADNTAQAILHALGSVSRIAA